jgi:hypothetical protein
MTFHFALLLSLCCIYQLNLNLDLVVAQHLDANQWRALMMVYSATSVSKNSFSTIAFFVFEFLSHRLSSRSMSAVRSS